MIPSIAYIHPTLLLSLSDHLNRYTACNENHTATLLGLILGRHVKGKSVSLLYAFELPESEYTNAESFEKHLNLLGEVYGKGYLELVGFYMIGTNINKDDVIRRQFDLLSRIKNTSPYSKDSQTSLIKTVDGEDDLVILQVVTPLISDMESSVSIYPLSKGRTAKLPFELRSLEAEKLTVATYSNAPRLPTKFDENSKSQDLSNVNVRAVVSSLENLQAKLNKAIAFLDGVKNGTIKVDGDKEKYEALQALSDLAGQIQAIKGKLQKEKDNNGVNSSDTEETNKLIAVGSLCSSLFRKNMDYSI